MKYVHSHLQSNIYRTAYFVKKSVLKFQYAFLVGEGGFEPPKLKAADLQSVPFGHSGTLPYITGQALLVPLELVIGLEPTTC